MALGDVCYVVMLLWGKSSLHLQPSLNNSLKGRMQKEELQSEL